MARDTPNGNAPGSPYPLLTHLSPYPSVPVLGNPSRSSCFCHLAALGTHIICWPPLSCNPSMRPQASSDSATHGTLWSSISACILC